MFVKYYITTKSPLLRVLLEERIILCSLRTQTLYIYMYICRYIHMHINIHIYKACMCAMLHVRLFVTLDYSLPGSSLLGILQARILE